VEPLQAAGWEGVLGFPLLSVVLVVMYYIPGSSAGNHFENALDAFAQLGNSSVLLVVAIGNVFSNALAYFFAIYIIKLDSATTKTVMNNLRAIVVWVVALAIHWETFQYLQLIGFVILIIGTIIYNEFLPKRILNEFVYVYFGNPEDSEQEPLLSQRNTQSEE